MGFRRAKSTQGNTNCQKNIFEDDQVPGHHPRALKTVLMGTNIPHACIPGLVWQKRARRFPQFELKVGELGFPIHFVCVSAALYHRGHAAAIFSP